MFSSFFNPRSYSGVLNHLSSLAQSIPRPEPLTEEELSVYKEHNISEESANSIQQTIWTSSLIWKSQKEDGGYAQCGKDLFYRKSDSHSSGIEAFVLLPDREVGSGEYMRYIEALETSELVTYVFGAVMIKGRVHQGEYRDSDFFVENAEQLRWAFSKVGSHPSIVRLHTTVVYHRIIKKEKVPFFGFVFEYCKLGSLEKYVKEGHALDSREIRQISRNVANALAYMHDQEIAHRDVKEENILLKMEGGRVCAKLGDLGFAEKVDQFTDCGSPVHLPPEFWAKFPHKGRDSYSSYDGRQFDMWAFGNLIKWMVEKDHFIPDAEVDKIENMPTDDIDPAMVGYEHMLKLKDLYLNGSFYPEVVSSRVDTVRALYCQMLQFDPKDRPASMNEVSRRLEAIQERMG